MSNSFNQVKEWFTFGVAVIAAIVVFVSAVRNVVTNLPTLLQFDRVLLFLSVPHDIDSCHILSTRLWRWRTINHALVMWYKNITRLVVLAIRADIALCRARSTSEKKHQFRKSLLDRDMPIAFRLKIFDAVVSPCRLFACAVLSYS